MNEFAPVRTVLQAVAAELGKGYVTGCSWDGEFMRIFICKPGNSRRSWAMTFDQEADYSLDMQPLIAELARKAKYWFDTGKELAA